MPARKRDYTVGEAQRNLPDLVDRVAEGEAIEIRRRGRIVASVQPVGAIGRAGARVLGGLRGTAVMHDDLTDPVDEPWDVR